MRVLYPFRQMPVRAGGGLYGSRGDGQGGYG